MDTRILSVGCGRKDLAEPWTEEQLRRLKVFVDQTLLMLQAGDTLTLCEAFWMGSSPTGTHTNPLLALADDQFSEVGATVFGYLSDGYM